MMMLEWLQVRKVFYVGMAGMLMARICSWKSVLKRSTMEMKRKEGDSTGYGDSGQ